MSTNRSVPLYTMEIIPYMKPNTKSTKATIERTARIQPFVFKRANMMTNAASIINPIPRNEIHILVIESISTNVRNLLPLTHSKRFILYHLGSAMTKKKSAAFAAQALCLLRFDHRFHQAFQMAHAHPALLDGVNNFLGRLFGDRYACHLRYLSN